ncbi:MAG: efflux RND transporter permease subunit, partial [Paludibacteraceae bacterium]|nr:efflux RND transporter permease subunit [Paludibacteraceae bacterium]
MGIQHEEIAVYIDPDRLSAYGITPTTLQTSLLLHGIRIVGGNLGTSQPIQVNTPYKSPHEIAEQIIWSDPITHTTIRLKDVATIERHYPQPKQFVKYYSGNAADTLKEERSCLIINMEMVPGNNIVAFGDVVDEQLALLRNQLPPDIRFHRITDQPKVVNDSVVSFLKDIVISILVVIAVMLLLFPLRTALVASTGVPICIAVCIGLMYLTGIELNTVTLAALIFVLGMIVDDSVIVIDGYSDLLEKGHSRWYSAAVSTKQLFVPMTLATCAISGMFFPMTRIITGPLGDFVQLFPFAVLFALTASIFYATWATPYMAARYVKRANTAQLSNFEKAQNKFFDKLQSNYHQLLSICFNQPKVAYLLLVVAMGIGIFLLTRSNLQLLPKAERECFAVEIHVQHNADINETAQV